MFLFHLHTLWMKHQLIAGNAIVMNLESTHSAVVFSPLSIHYNFLTVCPNLTYIITWVATQLILPHKKLFAKSFTTKFAPAKSSANDNKIRHVSDNTWHKFCGTVVQEQKSRCLEEASSKPHISLVNTFRKLQRYQGKWKGEWTS